MSEQLILERAQAVVLAALPGSKDWTDDSADPKPDKLDAFVVSLTRDSAMPASMGSTLEECQLSLEVEVFTKYAATADGRSQATVKGRAVQAAIQADATIKSLVDYMTGDALEVDLAKGEERVARAMIQISILATV